MNTVCAQLVHSFLNDSAWVHEIFSGGGNLGDNSYLHHWIG